MTTRLVRWSALVLAACSWAWASAAPAADAPWPDHAVRLIVPFTPGGPTDTVARLVAERLQQVWKQPVVVDYRAGAGTMIGTDAVARAAPDGYTLGMAVGAFMINPSLHPKIPYDTRRDLTGLSIVARADYGLFVTPSLPVHTVPELIAYAKAHPGKLSYASPGLGTATHLTGAMLAHMAGLDMVHVPYKGSAPAQQDVIAGRTELLFDVLFSAMPFVKSGQLRLLAIASPSRSPSYPDVPTLNETLPGFAATSPLGIIAPSGLPAALRQRISGDVAAAVRSPDLAARMREVGVEPVGSTSEAYNALIASEIDKWHRVITAAGIHADD